MKQLLLIGLSWLILCGLPLRPVTEVWFEKPGNVYTGEIIPVRKYTSYRRHEPVLELEKDYMERERIWYVSSDPAVIRVAGDGRLQAVGEGKAVVTGENARGIRIERVFYVSRKLTLSFKRRQAVLGESERNLLETFGEPDVTGKSCYGECSYLYWDEDEGICIFYISQGKIAGFYTDVTENLLRLSQIEDSEDIAASACTVQYYTDQIEDRPVGVRVLDTALEYNQFDKTILNYMEQEIFFLSNSLRIKYGYVPFKWSEKAAECAAVRSAEMAERDYFDHINPEGVTPFDRMKEAGISYQSAGENIAAGYRDSVEVSFGWLNSPGHRENLMNHNFRFMGIGIEYAAYTEYGSYYTQMFYQ
ncbi:CAP domain-containing protein [Anaerolentibacter hominis]|uniref:CAP domain-containing protein n=1 Tax=Anaerolentibacter hominis TaxID=3079009 RepID=UPI0031B7F83A